MAAQKTCRLDLALQGGGSHGAFTWGVLDALLEDGRFEFDGISGTSAGAMNAVVLAAGFAEAKTEGFRLGGPPSPALRFGQRKVAHILARGGQDRHTFGRKSCHICGANDAVAQTCFVSCAKQSF